MRFVELRLIAYGPFTDQTLQFGPDAARVVMIYGSNEAGKSTALRAISSFLYGIPRKSGDAHVHRHSALRVGAVLALDDERQVSLVRRRSELGSLTDPLGHAVDESVLARALGGLPEALFHAMFGLNHETLREGAEALLRGGGDVGESLFDAALGARAVHEVLNELQTEADTLFRPRGKSPRLNEALRRLREAKERSRRSGLALDAWLKQEQAIAEDRQALEALKRRRHLVRVEHERLQRARQLLPLLGRHTQLRNKRAELGAVVPLAADASAKRIELQHELVACASELTRLRQDIDKLEARRRETVVDTELAGLDEHDVEALSTELGRRRAALADLPRRLGEQRALLAEITALEAHLCAGQARGERTELGVALGVRVRRLAQEHGGLLATRNELERRVRERQAKLDTHEARMAELSPPGELSELRRSVRLARRSGDLDARIATQEREQEQTQTRLGAALQALGLWRGTPQELVELPLPGLECIEHHAKLQAEHTQRVAALGRSAQELERAQAECEQQLEALFHAGSVPSEEHLRELRQRRDEAWQALRDGVDPRARAETVRSFETLLTQADATSDRLRREADRVAKHATLRAQQTRLKREQARLEQAREQLSDKVHEAREQWRSLWNPHGIEPLPAADMRDWWTRLSALRELALREAKLGRELERCRLERRERREQLSVHLAALELAPDPGEELAPSLDQAQQVLSELEQRAAQRRALEQNVREERQEQRERRAERDDCLRALRDWQARWTHNVTQLGLAPDAAPDEALAELELLSQLRAKQAELERLERRITGMQRDGEQFRARVKALASMLRLGQHERAPEALAEGLLKEHREHKERLLARERGDEDLAERRALLHALERRKGEAQARLEQRISSARAHSVEELEQAEQRSELAARLDTELTELEAELALAGQGASVSSLHEEVQGLDIARVGVQLSETRAELTQLEQDLEEVAERLARNEAGLDLQKEKSAANAAAEIQHCAADVRAYAARYMRARLAATVLEREVRRYCEEHQAPLLARASLLLCRLSEGRYVRLHARMDGKGHATLRCARDDGRELEVHALSDGTRDQLYLALRLASLERYVDQGCRLPLVLDDALVHFDDARARAALEVLAEVAEHTQVLFFTHHARLLDLAGSAVPKERKHVVRLPEPRRPAPLQPQLSLD